MPRQPPPQWSRSLQHLTPTPTTIQNRFIRPPSRLFRNSNIQMSIPMFQIQIRITITLHRIMQLFKVYEQCTCFFSINLCLWCQQDFPNTFLSLWLLCKGHIYEKKNNSGKYFNFSLFISILVIYYVGGIICLIWEMYIRRYPLRI